MIKTIRREIPDIILKRETNKERITDYLSDESRIIIGNAEELIYARNEEDVIKAIIEANLKKKRLTISGAGTGITGSRVPLGGSILSLEQFTKINREPKENEEIINHEEFGKEYRIIIGKDEKGYYAIVPPGISIKVLEKIVEERGLFYPIDPTETSSLIGGNVATNASGSRSFKYGSTRDFVRRLRIVLPFGDILEIKRGEHFFKGRKIEIESSIGKLNLELPNYEMPKVEKNAAGYYIKENMDLIDLFIGSEGTLGVFTEIELKLLEKPKIISAIFNYFDDEYLAVNFAKRIRKEAKESRLPVIAIEFFDYNSVEFLREKYENQIAGNVKAIIDLEIEAEDEEERDKVFEKIIAMASEFKGEAYYLELNEAKEIRHALPEGVNKFIRIHGTKKVASDIAVSEENFDEMYRYYHEIGKESKIRYVLFGHIGNFHLHFNFLPSNEEELEKAEKYLLKILKKCIELKGTISAEHGIGKKYYVEGNNKKPLISLVYNERVIKELINFKKKIDPNLILNIGNIIPEEYLINN